MSRVQRCNRCAAEVTLPAIEPRGNTGAQVVATLGTLSALKGWAEVSVAKRGPLFQPAAKVMDLCEDCVEILLEQFMVGAEVAPITQPLERTPLPHQPMLDCQLIWNPGKGGLLCRHDDPELFDALVVDQERFSDEAGTTPSEMSQLQESIRQTVEDINLAGVAHGVPQRCGPECSEAHTYEAGCLLDNLTKKVPSQRIEGETELGDE